MQIDHKDLFFKKDQIGVKFDQTSNFSTQQKTLEQTFRLYLYDLYM